MRGIVLCVILLLSGICAKAQVKVQAELQDSTVSISITLDKGWHLYGKTKEIEKPSVSCSLTGVQFSKLQFKEPATLVNDTILQEKVPVYNGIVQASLKNLHVPEGVAVIPIVFHGYASDGVSFLPIEKELRLQVGSSGSKTRVRIPSMQVTQLANETSSTGLIKVFLLGLLGGLVALITPCVFPMIPVTVSFFGARTSDRKQGIRLGILYGAAILLIYLLASAPFHLLSGVRPELLNNISTSVRLNLVFFVVFVFFALSLFGVFELRLPFFVATKADQKSNIGSLAGIFFLALTLVIVSFSCTGPILGSLLVSSVSGSGGAWLLTAGMAGFGVALGLPFALFAIFPQWLSRLPKSGSWLSAVKISLGFVELALAFKFLSNADLVMQWGLLKREVIIGIWLLIAIAWLLYMIDIRWWLHYGKLRVSRGAWVMIVVLVLTCVYLGSGVFGAPVSGLSGFAPPSFYSLSNRSSKKLEADVINNYEKALALARSQNKKLLIDFTGWACVNCRKMEEQVWTDPRVMQQIRDQFVLVSLYVDDKTALPAEKQLFGYIGKDHSQKDIRTLGDLHAAMEAENLGQVSQPLYAMVDVDERLLAAPVGYTPDAAKFAQWLAGVQTIKNKP